jgi:hypothetical protein
MIEDRAAEGDRLLESIPPEAIGPRELRKLHSAALGRAGPRLRFPLGWVSLLLRRDRESSLPAAEEMAALARGHYTPYRDVLRAAGKELADLVEEIAGPAGAAGRTAEGDEASRAAGSFIAALDERLDRVCRGARVRAHLIPGILLLAAVWFAVQPAVGSIARDIAEGRSVEWTAGAGRLLASLIAALSPAGILSFICLVAAAYAVAAWLDWKRIRRAVEMSLGSFESAVREGARAEGRVWKERLIGPLDAWERERGELEEILGG